MDTDQDEFNFTDTYYDRPINEILPAKQVTPAMKLEWHKPPLYSFIVKKIAGIENFRITPDYGAFDALDVALEEYMNSEQGKFADADTVIQNAINCVFTTYTLSENNSKLTLLLKIPIVHINKTMEDGVTGLPATTRTIDEFYKTMSLIVDDLKNNFFAVIFEPLLRKHSDQFVTDQVNYFGQEEHTDITRQALKTLRTRLQNYDTVNAFQKLRIEFKVNEFANGEHIIPYLEVAFDVPLPVQQKLMSKKPRQITKTKKKKCNNQ